MEQSEYHEYLHSAKWKSLRNRRLRKDGHRCRLCNRKATQVHHRQYPEVLGEEGLGDLTSLCKSCHGLFHASGATLAKPRRPSRNKRRRAGGGKAANDQAWLRRVRAEEEEEARRIAYMRTLGVDSCL